MLLLRKILLHNILFISLLLISIFFAIYRVKNLKSVYEGSENELIIKIIDYKIDGNSLQIEGKGKEKIKISYYFNSIEEKNEISNYIEYGNFILVKGELKIPNSNTVSNLFNYKKYLNNNGIFWLFNAEHIELHKKTNNIFYKLKNKINKKVKNYKNNTYIYAYILGDTDKILEKVNDSYKTNGITHLFALSGLHVSIFALIIMKILEIFKISEIKKYIFVFVFLIFFSFITGFSPSILRASLLFFLLGINKIFYFYIKSENILILTCSILLFFKPFDLFNVGFQLSYVVTYFLIVSNYLFKNKNIIETYLLVSSISFIASLPITINLNNEINLISILNNILFVPLITYIVFPLTLCSFIFPFLENILNIFTTFMENISLFLSKCSINIIFKDVHIILLIAYYIFLILSIKSKKLNILFINLILILFVKFNYIFDSSIYFYFLDVGQGDSALIRTNNNKTIVIDTGGKESFFKEKWEERNNQFSIGKDTLIPFYKNIGVNKINFLVLTHGDYDHMGEAINLVENFKVEKVIFNCGEFNELEKDLIKVLDKKKIPYYSCIKELNIDDNKLYFLNNKDYGNENDNSSVIYTELSNHKFLFMGDAGVEVEEYLIKKYNLQDIDVLKVGHHGSKTSSSKNFIDKIEPKYSVISVGKNNRYGHPNKEVLNSLKDTKIYRTDQEGSIMLKIKNNKLRVETCAPYEGVI